MAATAVEEWVALAAVWIAFVLSFVSLFWYGYQMKLKQCGWEVVYVAILEAVTYMLIVLWGNNAPFTWKVEDNDGAIIEVPFVRYAEWLITCPVILIALANLTGLKDDYNWRTMTLLSADQGTILCGATAAMCTGWLRVVFFFFGACYGIATFYNCLQVYIESYANVPAVCKRTVATLAYMFMFSWGSFPALFLMGPEGFGHINIHWSTILHSVADFFSKNLWGLYAWYLRIQVREYHRKKWFEEQEKMKKGEDEFQVDNERRPEVSLNAVNTVLTGTVDHGDEEVDPYYAEYRRRRRRNRGRSLSEPEAEVNTHILMGGVAAPVPQDVVLRAPMMAQAQNPMLGMNGMMGGSPVMGMGRQQAGMMAATPMNMYQNNNPMANPTFANQANNVIVADNMGFQVCSFFVSKLQSDMGVQVFPVNNKQELIQKLELSVTTGTAMSAIFVIDGMLQQSEAFALQNQFRVPFVQYGMAAQPNAMFGEAYLQSPMPGQNYNMNELIMLFNKLRTQQLGAPPGAMQLASPSANNGLASGVASGMATPVGTSATDAGTSVDVLMAEMNALKQYLNNSATT